MNAEIQFDFIRTFKNRYMPRIVGIIFLEKLFLFCTVAAKYFDPYCIVSSTYIVCLIIYTIDR
jgi:hypothetical protein